MFAARVSTMRRLLAKGGGRSAAKRADDGCCTANRLWWARSELPQASRILTRRRVLLKLLVSGLEIRESFEMETGGISLVHMIRLSQPLPIGVAIPWRSAANRSGAVHAASVFPRYDFTITLSLTSNSILKLRCRSKIKSGRKVVAYEQRSRYLTHETMAGANSSAVCNLCQAGSYSSGPGEWIRIAACVAREGGFRV